MQTLWMMGKEVEDSPVLLDVRLGVGFKSMDHVWELHSITDKKNGEIVSHQIKVTLIQQGHNMNKDTIQNKKPSVLQKTSKMGIYIRV